MKIRSKVTIGLLSSVMCVAAFAHAASTYTKVKTSDEGITFVSDATAVDIDGKVPEVTIAQEEGGKLVFKVELHKLDTGIDLRDRHTKELLRVAKYPMAELKVPKTVDPKGSAVTGQFTLNGATKDVKVSYKAEGAGPYKITATFNFDITDFNVEEKKLCYLGVCANKHTKITAKVTMKPPAG